jgi:hypothetical protein
MVATYGCYLSSDLGIWYLAPSFYVLTWKLDSTARRPLSLFSPLYTILIFVQIPR